VKRVEKVLAACATGRWVLRPSFLQASIAAGRWVEEAEHEWQLKPGTAPTDLTAAPRRCRLLVAKHGQLRKGVFSDMRVQLTITDERKRGIVSRVMSAGGAEIFQHPADASPTLNPVGRRESASRGTLLNRWHVDLTRGAVV
jgi:hypothetical protein